MVLAVPLLLEIFTNPLTIFGDAGTLAAFGFLLAYYLISIAAPVFLAKIHGLKRLHVAMAVLALLFLLVPTIGSFYPVPAFPVSIFPYIFLTYMVLGSGWLYAVNRRKPGVLTELAQDLASHPTTLERDRAADMVEDEAGTSGTIDLVAASVAGDRADRADQADQADQESDWATKPA